MRKFDGIELSQKFNGMTIDNAIEYANKTNKTLLETYLENEMGNPQGILKLMDTKKGLVKTGDEYASPNQFAVSGYELFDLTPNLPLAQFFHQGIMPVRVGGGFAETVSALRLSYALAKKRLAGGSTNEVNVPEVTPVKISVPAYTFKFGIVQGQVDLLKSASVAYDVLGYKLEVMRLSYQRELDFFAFLGNFGINGITTASSTFAGGLLNSAEVDAEEVISDWADWTVEDFITNFVRIITYLKTLNRWNMDVIPDTVVFPPELWERFAQPAVVGTVGASSGAGIAMSNLDYLKQQLSVRLGRAFNFIELPYISVHADADYTTAGIVAKGEEDGGQIIFMRNSDKVVRMPIAMPLVGGQLAWSPTEDGYRQNFLAVVGCPMFVYPTGVYRLYNKMKDFAVTYNLDSGTNGANPTAVNTANLPFTLLPATKSGNTFNGWFTDSGKTIPITKLTERKAYTLYAKFTAI